GTAATVTVGSTTSGDKASVSNSGTANAAILDFVLPKGDKGDQGEQGAKGDKGDTGAKGAGFYYASVEPASNQISVANVTPAGVAIGDYVITGGGNIFAVTGVDVSNVTTGASAVASLKGPKGDTGAAGADGAKGDKGDQGEQGPKGDKGDAGEGL